MLNPATAYRFFLQHDEHDIRMHIQASISAAAKLSMNLGARESGEARKISKLSKKKGADLGELGAADHARIQDETRRLQNVLQQIKDLRHRILAVNGTLETFLSSKVDYEVDVLNGLPGW